jgi:ribosomal protein S18 acetylase RimI-like enzyme
MAVDSAPDFKTSAVLPPIPGLRFRHFAGPSDYAAMNDAANAAREANDDHFITPLDGFANFYGHLENCDKDRDLFIVEVDGSTVGYGRTWWFDEPDGSRVHEVICFLHPDWRRRGIGRAMLATLEERAADVAREQPSDGPSTLQAGDDAESGADALLLESGYEPIRHGYTMVRPNLDPVPGARLPDGLEIRPVRDEDLRAIWEAAHVAFRDSWGYREPTELEYELFLTDPLQSDRTLWRVAWDGDQVAGQVRGFINTDENERFGQKRGWVENISVGRPWRKRGLARALINEVIAALRERGMTEGALGVDTQNVSGALRLYESVGFRPVTKSTTYRKPMTAG